MLDWLVTGGHSHRLTFVSLIGCHVSRREDSSNLMLSGGRGHRKTNQHESRTEIEAEAMHQGKRFVFADTPPVRGVNARNSSDLMFASSWRVAFQISSQGMKTMTSFRIYSTCIPSFLTDHHRLVHTGWSESESIKCVHAKQGIWLLFVSVLTTCTIKNKIIW